MQSSEGKLQMGCGLEFSFSCPTALVKICYYLERFIHAMHLILKPKVVFIMLSCILDFFCCKTFLCFAFSVITRGSTERSWQKKLRQQLGR